MNGTLETGGKTTERRQWNDTPLAKLGQWHEAQAQTLREYKALFNPTLKFSAEALDKDIAFHSDAAQVIYEAQ